jgi:hypothetical protein
VMLWGVVRLVTGDGTSTPPALPSDGTSSVYSP